MRRYLVIFLITLGLISFGKLAEAGDLVSAEISSSVISSREMVMVRYQISEPTDICIKVFNEKGDYIRTLTAHYQTQMKGEVPWNGKNDFGKLVSPGKYFIRVDVGLKATLDKSFGQDGKIDTFVSPFDIEMDSEGKLYVLDRGNKSLCKFTPDGRPVKEFGEEGELNVPALSCIKIDSKGNIYMDARHTVAKFDSSGCFFFSIGGWFGGVANPECVYNPMGIGMGPEDKIYIRRGGYEANIVVYNHNFSGKEGFLYVSGKCPLGSLPPRPPTIPAGYYGPSMDTTIYGEIYGTSYHSTLCKAVDTGKEIISEYQTGNGLNNKPLRNPIGVCHDGRRCLYIADWGNGRVVKFYDSGAGFKPVWSFGQFGQSDLEKGYFINLHDVCVSKDEKDLYIVEDGELVWNYISKTTFPFPGNHRLSKWNLGYSYSKKFEIEVKK